MKRLLLAVTATAFFAGASAAQSPKDQSQTRTTVSHQDKTKTGSAVDRRDKAGAVQTYNAGPNGESVGKDTQDTLKTGSDRTAANAPPVETGTNPRRTGVATGFVAAGIGLAMLGLFVRKRERRRGYPHDDHDETDRFDGPGGLGGSGTSTRM